MRFSLGMGMDGPVRDQVPASVIPRARLRGSAAFTVSAASAATGSVALSSSADLEVSGSGAATGSLGVDATAELGVICNCGGSGSVSMNGSGAFASSGAGAGLGSAPMTAEGDVSFDGAGAASGTAALSASAVLSVDGSGSGGGGAFDAVNLFSGGVVGFVLQWNDSSTVFEETTSPSTPATGLVGTIQDRTSNGVDFSAPADGNRPTLDGNVVALDRDYFENTTHDISGWPAMRVFIGVNATSDNSVTVMSESTDGSGYAGIWRGGNTGTSFALAAGSVTFHIDNAAQPATQGDAWTQIDGLGDLVLELRNVDVSSWGRITFFQDNFYTMKNDDKIGPIVMIEETVAATGTNAADIRTWIIDNM